MPISDEGVGPFEQALRILRERLNAAGTNIEEEIADALAELAGSALPEEERSRRARRLTEVLRDEPDFSAPLLVAVRAAAAEIRAGVLAALPQEMRARVYVPDPDGLSESGNATLPPVEPVTLGAEASDYRDVEAPGEWRTVLLLGEPHEVEPNERFLESEDYRAIRVSTERELVALNEESYCAVVIHPGFWSGLDTGRSITDVLTDQFARSTIAVYKVDSSGFGSQGDEILALIDGLSVDAANRVTLAEGSRLNRTDLARIDPYARLLESSVAASVTVEDLGERETRLLTTAASLFAARLRSQPVPTRARDVTVAALTDGRSGARVFRVLLPGLDVGFVAKFNNMSLLADELETARLVMPAAQQLEIEIYALGGAAVLLQRLVADNDEPLRAAPSFKERLEARGAWERGRRGITEPRGEDLTRAIARLVRTLKQINAVDAGTATSRCWMGVEPLEELASHGVRFQIEADEGTFDPRNALEVVHDTLASHADRSLVHGDLHAGNVLMADDRTPLLIDFANAGAGHPLFDLVRFGAAVAFLGLRPVVPEQRMRDLFMRLHVEGDSAEDLAGAFPDVVASDSAGVVIEALCAVRFASFELLAGDQADLQYLAMTYLVAAQSLTMYEFQAATVRAALAAIYPTLMATVA